MAFTHFIIVEVMSRGDFNAATAKVLEYIVISNNRNDAITKRKMNLLAN